ncbi:FtsX-like permease family protein [Streptomyces sp. NPDC059785]|uniref:FtsX-like permease family protein n=1 Tax=Streptomyces sp. NPDC059785 TaxID=3346945 RepID=UPI00365A6862
MNVRQWSRDLVMGARFAVTGGREGWVRLLLTGVGVGLGVALLLVTTSIPNLLSARQETEDARTDYTFSQQTMPKADDTLLVATMSTTYRDQDIRGRMLEPEGERAPVPPGVSALPKTGEMVVSPALDRLLKSDDGKLLRERLPYRTAGTIGESGLLGPQELTYYVGGEGLASRMNNGTISRIDAFRSPHQSSDPLDPVLVLLILVIFVVLLLPVGVFIAAAVRFGGERRDRRLAALRLVGADGRMTRRIAAGEAVAGAIVGLAFGAGFFLVGRQLVAKVEVWGESVFPSQLSPSPALAALIALAVPAAAVAVTLFALRGVVIEPLGVVRAGRPPRRRLWWRLLLPLGGAALLAPMIGKGSDGGDFNQYMVIGGVLLLLVGVTALLPWLVETVVARLGAGAVSWQLAVRRLQLSSGTAARMVNGIAVAVAGAIALQMLFAGASGAFTKSTGKDVTRAQMEVSVPKGLSLREMDRRLTDTRSVRHTVPLSNVTVGDRRTDPELVSDVSVGDCAALRELAKLPSCEDGDVFAVRGAQDDTDGPALTKAGRTVYLDPGWDGDAVKSHTLAYTVPRDVKPAVTRKDPTGWERGGLLLTEGAVPEKAAQALWSTVYVQIDTSDPDAYDLVRNTVAKADPLANPMTWSASDQSKEFASIRTGLFVGATCVLFLIGASLLVSQLEQLRDRRKLLSALVAFGTRRRTLALSVLWQTALPIVIGLVLATVVGLVLGVILLRMAAIDMGVDWLSVASMAGSGAVVVLLVTALSLPPLLRLLRPDGLRTE